MRPRGPLELLDQLGLGDALGESPGGNGDTATEDGAAAGGGGGSGGRGGPALRQPEPGTGRNGTGDTQAATSGDGTPREPRDPGGRDGGTPSPARPDTAAGDGPKPTTGGNREVDAEADLDGNPDANPDGGSEAGLDADPGAGPDIDEGAGADEGDSVKAAIEEAARRAGAVTEELDPARTGLDPVPDTDIPDGAKPRFPCPTPDPEALANAKTEPGIPLLPERPWILRSSLLSLYGLKYHGIVEVRRAGGELRKALKFTARAVDIKDLHQRAEYPMETTMHVRGRAGSTSTIREGTVTMYTEELRGDLFGIFPVVFSPETPPPVDIPWVFFTDVTVVQAGQFGGALTIPGLRNTLTR
ncbi:hypothetical protein ACFVIM_29605 [Streptomyces sp. NPDC057638]|uniref:hypothetical protein n=1 Tax=Streptomyces sp. NPDC057638 TaxID=3346190 RepID=UPI0036903550